MDFFNSRIGLSCISDVHEFMAQNRMTYLADFGESGKNFIEIGKQAGHQETMLGLRRS